MTTLNARAQSIRADVALALGEQERDDILLRAASLVQRLDSVTATVRKASTALAEFIDRGVVEKGSKVSPSVTQLSALVDRAEEEADPLPQFVRSALPGEIELAASGFATALHRNVSETWKQYAAEKTASLQAAGALLETTLGSIPRFRTTVEAVRYARLKLGILKAREMPTRDEIREFQSHLATLEDAAALFEREVPERFRDALRRCATPDGLHPSAVPDGFFAWIEEIGADGYFKVALSHS